MGQPGSRLEHPGGESFHLRRDVAEGAAHSNRNLTVPLPKGGTVAHVADIAVELESGRTVYVDIVDAHATFEHLKAAAYDAVHLKQRKPPPVPILVVVRSARSLIRQEQVEALAHPYDYTFGVEEENVGLELKFAACRSEIAKRLRNP